ncbi:hypothetical protein PQX77_002308 [Marasmius sp. AFHP31]|nr:hypothetical protein PQX77_002308 [Marasmius sp. AFHP31]
MSNPPEPPAKHRGAEGWFPPEEREWLFAQARTDEFRNSCLDVTDTNEDDFKRVRKELGLRYVDKFREKIDLITANVTARETAAEKSGVPDPEIADLKKKYPYGYAKRIQQFWRNRKAEHVKNSTTEPGLRKEKGKAPLRLQVPAPRSPRKIYHDSFRGVTSTAVGARRKEDGISHLKHVSMLNAALAEGYANATDAVREDCERVANEERELWMKEEGVIYQAQEHVQEFIGSVVSGLAGSKRGQVGNMWFHGVGAYRDKDETLKLFSVDTANETNSADNGAFSHQPFYPEFFKRVQLFAADRVPLNNVPAEVATSTLPTYDFEAVTPAQQRSLLLTHIEGHYTSTLHRDLPVPWDAIAASPGDYLIAPPTTFQFGDPTKLPYQDLPPAAKYFWEHPSFFKIPSLVPREPEENGEPAQSTSGDQEGTEAPPAPEPIVLGRDEHAAEGSVHPRKRKGNRNGNAIDRPSVEEPRSSAQSRGRGAGDEGVGFQKRPLRSNTAKVGEAPVKRRTLLASGPKAPGRPSWDLYAEDKTPPASVAPQGGATQDEAGDQVPTAGDSAPTRKRGRKGKKNQPVE